MKDFAMATLTFSGVLSLHALLLGAVLASPDSEAVIAMHEAPSSRQVTYQLPEPESVETSLESVEQSPGDMEETAESEAAEHDYKDLPTTESKVENINPPSLVSPPIQKKEPKKKKRRNRYRNCGDNDGISSTDVGFAVQRDVVDYYANIAHYRDLGYVSWYKSDTGSRAGFRLRRINCDLREAGIRNGDVVTSVNGQTVQTIPQAIKLWLKVRRKNRVVLQVIRRGESITINYELI